MCMYVDLYVQSRYEYIYINTISMYMSTLSHDSSILSLTTFCRLHNACLFNNVTILNSAKANKILKYYYSYYQPQL